MKITDISPQKHNKNRMSVFVDGEYSFSLTDTDIILMGVKIGGEITQSEIEEYNIRCNYTKALAASLDIISRKAATKKQVCDKLKSLGYDEDIISDVCNELNSMGYMDDIQYAQEFAKDAFVYKKHGKDRIVQELRHRGVSSSDVAEALKDMNFDTQSNINDLLKGKFRTEDFSDDKTKQRAMRYLMYRGYSPSDAKEGISRYMKGDTED